MKVLIADDYRLLRDSFKNIIEQNSDIQVVACATNGAQALQYCEIYKPDLVLMDIYLSVYDGLVATKLIKSKFPQIKILILTSSKDDFDLAEALFNGADGYILKDIGADELILSIKSIAVGLGVIQRELLYSIVTRKSENISKIRSIELDGVNVILSKRQLEILKMIVMGFDNKQISKELCIAVGTVKNNVTEIISKFRVKDRTQLAIYAIRNSVVPL
ncbi:MAG: two component transcriptional regulator, LuxR family [Firmicutes bacterium]|nr:two component transcriptional regulator, LuxR family [Bacillota bacterium]